MAGRVTVLIEPEGRIAFYHAYPDSVGRSTGEILRLVRAVQFARRTGLGAPANWHPGDPGIRRSIDAGLATLFACRPYVR